MAKYQPENIRTFALLGHGGAGKTSLAEAILFATGATTRMGKVDDGTAKTDYDAEEIKRKTSIHAVPITVDWKGTELNIVDCPGFADFAPQMDQVLHCVDGVVLVVDAQAGAGAIADRGFSIAKEKGLPVVVFMNKLDKENTEQAKALSNLKEELEGNFVPFTMPIGAAADLSGCLDVVSKKATTYDDKGKATVGDVPADMMELLDEVRGSLVEAAADADDAVAEKFLMEEPLTDEEINKALRKGCVDGTTQPVVGGSATRAIGVDVLLDLCVNYLPSPLEAKHVVMAGDEEKVIDPKDGTFVGQIFKVLNEAHLGEVSLMRVFSGSCKSSETVVNVGRREKEKLAGILRLQGKERVDADELVAGQIGALVKLKSTKVNDTLASEGKDLLRPVCPFPEPLISVALNTVDKGDQDKLATALSKMGNEDPLLTVRLDTITHETIAEAQGETQLNIFLNKLKEKYKVNVEVAKPKIAYQETIRKKGEGQGKHKKQSGGRGQFGDVHIRFEPCPEEDFVFADETVGGCVPGKFIPAVEKGLREALVRGVLAGFPTKKIKCVLFFGSYHAVDSSEIAFKTAAAKCFKKVVPTCSPVLLEPIMNVEVTVPEAFMGDIMGDMNTRRAKIQGMEPMGRKQCIKAQVPLAEMHKYIIQLRSMTEGKGVFKMTPSHYEEVPHAVAEEVIKEYKQADEEEE